MWENSKQPTAFLVLPKFYSYYHIFMKYGKCVQYRNLYFNIDILIPQKAWIWLWGRVWRRNEVTFKMKTIQAIILKFELWKAQISRKV